MKFALPATWSGSDLLSFVVAMGGVVPGSLVAITLFRITAQPEPYIDELSSILLSVAGLLGIPVFIFGAWMCLRRIGRPFLRFLALGLGSISIAAWPVADYLAGGGTGP